MARARRAKPRTSRIVVPVLVVLLAGGAAVAAQQGAFDTSSPQGVPDAGSRSAAAPTASSSTTTPTAPTSASREPSPSSSTDAGADALAGCRRLVAARDDVLRAAGTGIGHWSEHVRAQTDADAGRISVEAMDAVFARTRLAGPADVKAYEAATKDLEDQDGSCDVPAGAASAARDRLERCDDRRRDQRAVLAAAQDAMADWRSHLAAMQRSRMSHVDDAQGVWLRAWRAAPPHLEAYDDATRDFDAPRC